MKAGNYRPDWRMSMRNRLKPVASICFGEQLPLALLFNRKRPVGSSIGRSVLPASVSTPDHLVIRQSLEFALFRAPDAQAREDCM